MTSLSVIAWIIGVFFAYKYLKNNAVKSLFFSIALIIFLYVEIYLISDQFTDQGINESVWYHLYAGFEGAGFGDFKSLIILSILLTSLGLIFLCGIWTTKFFSRKLQWIPFIPLCISLWLGPLGGLIKNEASEYFFTRLSTLKLDDIYKNSEIINIQKKKNIIYVYLEGFELTYLKDPKYKNEFPNLRHLRENSLSFENVQQTWGTGWTIAGMVASQCGVPLITPDGANNSLNQVSEFMGGVNCLGDIFKANDYSLHYMGGASTDFAGKGSFYKSHGFSDVRGREELTKSSPGLKLSAWGVYDDHLFNNAEKEISELFLKNKPFAFHMLTVDTHPPHGHISESCKQIYDESKERMVNALRCTDYLLGKFVSNLKDKNYKNYILVIASDHLAMKNEETTVLNKNDRRNLLLMNGPEIVPEKIYKNSSPLDIAPTILGLLGNDEQKFGYGRNILSDVKTLVEEYGDRFSILIKSKRNDLAKIVWNFPNLKNTSIKFSVEKNEASLGKQKIKAPLAIIYDDNYDVTNIMVSNYGAKSISEFALETKPKNLVWIDSCHLLSKFNNNNAYTSNTQFCAIYGSLGWKEMQFTELKENKEININSLIHKIEFEFQSSEFKKRERLIKDYVNFGAENIEIIDSSILDLKIPLTIISRGTATGGPSELRYFGKRDIEFTRGLTLVGINNNGPQKIAHIDSYDRENPFQDKLQQIDPKSLSKTLKKYEEEYPILILVSSNSAQSGEFDLKNFSENTGLEKIKILKNLMPYIAVFKNGKVFREFSAPANSSYAIVISK